jgi:glycosyltransferase involved in cell wall biosynthesis
VNLDSVTPLILTFNEAPNIVETLHGLRWARRVVIVDSYSNDATVEHARPFENVRLIQREFDNHTAQWNFGLDQIETPWVLALDADYLCPSSLVDELRALSPKQDAYAVRFRYCIHGRPLRATLYPPRVVLFRASLFRYIADGHTQKLDVSGPAPELQTQILHYDRKPLARWLVSQAKYAELEAAKLSSARGRELSWKDRLRRWPFVAPMLTIFYCLFGKRLILDGRVGLHYTLQRVYAELLLNMTLLDRKLRTAPENVNDRVICEQSFESSPEAAQDDHHVAAELV